MDILYNSTTCFTVLQLSILDYHSNMIIVGNGEAADVRGMCGNGGDRAWCWHTKQVPCLCRTLRPRKCEM